MKRGDVFSAATGSGFGSKPRPVIVIQADPYMGAPVIMVAPLTHEKHAIRAMRPLIMPDETNGLRKPSAIATNTLIAVRQSDFGKRIGSLSPADCDRMDNALRLVLGLT